MNVSPTNGDAGRHRPTGAVGFLSCASQDFAADSATWG